MKAKQEVHVLKVWSFYVQLLGKTLHAGGLINQILPIVELGFKNSNPTIKVAAYKAWESLIDNFALNQGTVCLYVSNIYDYNFDGCLVIQFAVYICPMLPTISLDIIGDHKRVKLIMQVFKINNSKLESVALEKLRVWWHFVVQLKEKASLYFDQVGTVCRLLY